MILRKFVPVGSSGSSTVQAAPAKGSAPKVSGGKSQQLPLIEDWQLPPRYRRRALDEKEIDAINVCYLFFEKHKI